jgi:hypothetical protein
MIMRKKFIRSFVFAGVLALSGCNSANIVIENVNSANKVIVTPEMSKTFEGQLPLDLQVPAGEVGQRLLREYGAIFVVKGGAVAPRTVIFKDEAEVAAWQASVPVSKETIGGVEIVLQTPAMNALKKAVNEARENKLSITPRGIDAARRSYKDTEELWASRVNPGLQHWEGKGRLSKETAAHIRSLSPFEQVPEIFKLEADGLFFSKDLSKSIIFSVAPPGSSQHLSMLALDVSEFDDPKIREILAHHGWFRTVVSDLPHFTYLGSSEQELPGAGLKKAEKDGQVFWIPG